MGCAGRQVPVGCEGVLFAGTDSVSGQPLRGVRRPLCSIVSRITRRFTEVGSAACVVRAVVRWRVQNGSIHRPLDRLARSIAHRIVARSIGNTATRFGRVS